MLGVFFKAARIGTFHAPLTAGERLSPYCSLACIAMAVYIVT